MSPAPLVWWTNLSWHLPSSMTECNQCDAAELLSCVMIIPDYLKFDLVVVIDWNVECGCGCRCQSHTNSTFYSRCCSISVTSKAKWDKLRHMALASWHSLDVKTICRLTQVHIHVSASESKTSFFFFVRYKNSQLPHFTGYTYIAQSSLWLLMRYYQY